MRRLLAFEDTGRLKSGEHMGSKGFSALALLRAFSGLYVGFSRHKSCLLLEIPPCIGCQGAQRQICCKWNSVVCVLSSSCLPPT